MIVLLQKQKNNKILYKGDLPMKANFSRVLVTLLCLCMCIALLPAMSLAADEEFVSETHEVFSRTTSTLAPGVTQDIVFAYSKDGKQMAYYVATADVTRDDVVLQSSYKEQYENKQFGMEKLTNQIAYANALYSNPDSDRFISEYYNVVVGANASFFNMTTGQPSGVTYLDGVQIGESASYNQFFAILKDGSAIIDYTSNLSKYEGNIDQAVAGSQMVVWGGKDITANTSGSYNTERHCRTAIGVTADGKVVLMSLDGRQEPFSCGGSMHEIAQIMLEAGCVAAINLDGGGSTTFASRPEGKDKVEVINRPSDGSERAISTGIIIASLAAPSDVFDRAVLTAENDYVTPNSVVDINALGVSPAGTSAEIPENAVWQLEDASMGTVVDGVFTSNGTVGEAVVQLAVDGNVVGETTINVVIPEVIAFAQSAIVVPYGKTLTFSIKATVNGGLNTVPLKEGDIIFELSDSKLGIVDGFEFTACDETSGLTSGKVTAKFVYENDLQTTANLTFGKGSQVVYDFEDDDISGFGIKSAYFHKGPKYGRFGKGSFDLTDADDGFVKNGNNALAVTLDYSNFNSMGWKAVSLSGLNVDLTDAIAVGFWAYIPSTAVGMVEVDFNNAVIADSYISDVQADGFDGGWFYISTTDIKGLGSTLDSLVFYQQDAYSGAESDVNIMTKYTIYIDDITVDYSAAVDDRILPEFEYIRVTYEGLSDAVNMQGQIISGDAVSVTAKAIDNFELDESTLAVYVDGVKLSSDKYTYADGMITTDDIKLADGVHTFTLSIADTLGNTQIQTRSIVIKTDSDNTVVEFVPQNPDADQVFIGSVQWFDVKAYDAEDIQTVKMVLDLDGNSQWQLDNMIVANGFSAEYSINPYNNDATVIFTKNSGASVSGDIVIASLPIRTWEHTNHLTYPNDVYYGCSTADNDVANSPHTIWKTDAMCHIAIIVKVDIGYVEFVDGTSSTFSSEEYQIDTELAWHRNTKEALAEVKNFIQSTYSFHVHNEISIEDKAPTCTENGYVGRTVCGGCDCMVGAHSTTEGTCQHGDGCGSVINWGTTLPAQGHDYKLVDGVLSCACGELYNGIYEDVFYVDGVPAEGWIDDSYYVAGVALTGVQLIDGIYYNLGTDGISLGKYTGVFYDEADGVYRYAQLGELATGWKMIDNDWYYFRGSTQAAAVGKYVYGPVTYYFEENGRLTSGQWATDENGSRYYYGPKYLSGGWQVIDGNTYFFDKNCYRLEGYNIVNEFNSFKPQWYHFDENGVLIEMVTDTGLITVDGVKYYVENGLSQTGLYYVDGYYYYFNTKTYKAEANGEYTVTADNLNGLDFEPGVYTFNEEGQIVIAVKDGFVEEDGKIYYYVNGVLQKGAGLILVDGDYYYIKSAGTVATGRYYVTNNNGYMNSAYYEFDSTGKMIIPEVEEPEVKNGFVEENGKIYYYVNGVLQKGAGLILVDGDYYYIQSAGTAATGRYYVTNNNGYMNSAYYEFDSTGKMII